jgi:hypothetical protein
VVAVIRTRPVKVNRSQEQKCSKHGKAGAHGPLAVPNSLFVNIKDK